MRHALSTGGVVVHVLRVDPFTICAPDVAALYRAAPDDVQPGWLDDGQTFTAPPVNLPALRDAAREQVNTWRDEQEAAGIVFEHAGRSWDGGLTVRTRLTPLQSLPALPDGFFWTDAEDSDVPMTAADLHALHAAHEVAIVARGFEIHVRQRQMKADIDAMTAEQLGAFAPDWPGAPDTTAPADPAP